MKPVLYAMPHAHKPASLSYLRWNLVLLITKLISIEELKRAPHTFPAICPTTHAHPLVGATNIDPQSNTGLVDRVGISPYRTCEERGVSLRQR
jgi:hypothetical protein